MWWRRLLRNFFLPQSHGCASFECRIEYSISGAIVLQTCFPQTYQMNRNDSKERKDEEIDLVLHRDGESCGAADV